MYFNAYFRIYDKIKLSRNLRWAIKIASIVNFKHKRLLESKETQFSSPPLPTKLNFSYPLKKFQVSLYISYIKQ